MRRMDFFLDGVCFEEKTQVEKIVCRTEPLKMNGKYVIRRREGVGGKMGTVYKVRVIYEVEKQKRKGEGGEKVVLSNLRY